MKHDVAKYFRTHKRLQALINSCDPEFDEWCQQYMATLYEIELEGYCELPYWIEIGSLHGVSKATEKEDYYVEYRAGYHEPLQLGHIQLINGKEYKYLDSLPLCAELELQTKDGKYAHAYQGESFLRIWETLK